MAFTSNQIREKYLRFYSERNHARIPSARITPENDPTTLFTSSGMQPLVPYLLGEVHPKGARLVDAQKCFRAGDIEEIGDNRHTTFFEMLGNWSLGDYFKREQLTWFFQFLTDEVGLDPERLYVTVYEGDDSLQIPRDTEAAAVWSELFRSKGIEATTVHIGTEARGGEIGMGGGRIFYYEAKKNWWSRSGVPALMPAGEPGGPDSEVFYEFTDVPHNTAYGAYCHPNCDCGRFLEIGNSVFMEYKKTASGAFEKLPKSNVDFGGGLERITAAAQGTSDVFKIDSLYPLIQALENASTATYSDSEKVKSFRIVADHVRAATFIAADGTVPGNTDQGYVLRRLIRRTIRHMDALGITGTLRLADVSKIVCTMYAAEYTELEKHEQIAAIFTDEEERFRKTLRDGMRMFERQAGVGLSGEDAFILFSTYGFPVEMTEELAKERGILIDVQGFHDAMKKHQDTSRQGAEQKFKGGLADHSDMSVKYHTATHLLHKALRDVLGPTVAQKGSNITPERLRFDFSFERKMTDDEKKRVTEVVNSQIQKALPVTYEDLPLAEAEKRGAIGLFEEKYGDVVRVYAIGDYSLEFCGGPHVNNTGDLGTFVIQKEEAVAQGIRRIKAVLQ